MYVYYREIFINFTIIVVKYFQVDELIIAEDFTNDPVNYLRQKCESRNISLSELCKRANVDRSTVERWKEKNPNTIEIIERLQTALKAIPVC